jgi:hypothetical protein
MKSKRYSKRFAMTALGALFAMPVFAANIAYQGDVQYRDAAALPGSIIDPVPGNDVRDNRDSTLMRNDVGVVAVPPESDIDPANGNDFRDNRDSTILRNDVPRDQTNTQSSPEFSNSSGRVSAYE